MVSLLNLLEPGPQIWNKVDITVITIFCRSCGFHWVWSISCYKCCCLKAKVAVNVCPGTMQDCKTNLLQFSAFLCQCDSGKCGLFPILPLARWRRRRQPPPIANGFDMMPKKRWAAELCGCMCSSPQLVVSGPLRRTGLPADSPKPTSQHQKYLPVKATNQLPKNIG